MSGRVLVWLSFAIILASPPSARGAEISDLNLLIKNDKVLVSFRMTDAFPDDIGRAIASGLPVSFRYTIQLRRPRTAWMDQRVVSRKIDTTVTYDNLTERYKLSRDIDGEIEATEVVVDPNQMTRFMTTVENLELFDAPLLEPNQEYYVRVKGVVKERNLFLFIPWDVGSDWEKAYFTYLP